MKKMLKVRAVEGRLQPDFEAFESGIRRFVGCRFDQSIGAKDAKGIPQGGFVSLERDVKVPYRAEYVQAVKEGDLEAADIETARLCKVSFHQ